MVALQFAMKMELVSYFGLPRPLSTPTGGVPTALRWIQFVLGTSNGVTYVENNHLVYSLSKNEQSIQRYQP